MNAQSSPGRIALHLAALAHRPTHCAFHCRGIGREIHETGLDALLAVFGWMVIWLFLLI
jgi:hypothetical protein